MLALWLQISGPSSAPSRLSTALSPLAFLFLYSQAGPSFATHGGGGGGGGGIGMVASYSLTDLHADLNRWPAAYYSKQV